MMINTFSPFPFPLSLLSPTILPTFSPHSLTIVFPSTSYSQQPPVPRAALAQSYHTPSTDYGGDRIGYFSKPPTLPPRARASPPGVVPSVKSSVSATSSPGSGVGAIPSMRPPNAPIPATSYSHTSPPYSDGGRSSNVAASRPPVIHYTVPPTAGGPYYQDPQGHIPRASMHREAPPSPPYSDGGRSSNVAASRPPVIHYTVPPTAGGPYYQDPQGHIPRASMHQEAPPGYHPRQPLPGQSQRGTASPYHANLHSGYSAVSPASLSTISSTSEADSFRNRAYDDSSVHSGCNHDFFERDSPPSSNLSRQSAQPPDASQQMPQFSGRGGSRQPQPQQAPYRVTAEGESSPLPSRFAPPRGYTNAPQPSQQPFRPPRSGTAYPMPHISSQPGRGMDPVQLDVGIEWEIYHVAKDVMKSDSEAPQTLADEGIPYDPNLVCPKCHLGFRIGEIQNYRQHAKTCTVGGK